MTTTSAPSATGLDFGEPSELDRSLSELVRRLRGSEILRIGTEVRAMIASGRPVCNLTVGDFDPRQFPIPARLLAGIHRALDAGETNYPAPDGMLSLRRAVLDYVEREQGVRYPLESVLVTCGGRPVVYGAFRCVVDAGDTVVYSVPSWNNDHYANICGGSAVELTGRREHGFQPTLEQLAPHLGMATLLCLCSPNNPTGTIMPADSMREILEAVVEENRARRDAGRRALFVLFDQIYGSLVFPPAEHTHPLALVPDAAPWVIALDGISKAFAATGLRLGWTLAAPPVITRMKDLLGHVGAWAPRPEQVATAEFLGDPAAIAEFRATMDAALRARLEALYLGFSALREAGYPVDCIAPQGAIYLSLQLDLVGRRIGDQRIESNETIRRLLLDRAGLAVVPFQAFGLRDETGWFRLSTGAVSLQDIDDAFPRIQALLDQVE